MLSSRTPSSRLRSKSADTGIRRVTVIGYTLMCEQTGPKELIRHVQLAKAAGSSVRRLLPKETSDSTARTHAGPRGNSRTTTWLA